MAVTAREPRRRWRSARHRRPGSSRRARRLVRRGGQGRGRRRHRSHGQRDAERGPVAWRTGHLQGAPMRLDNPSAQRKPSPVPTPGGFVVKKGSKIRAWRAAAEAGPVSVTVSTIRCCAGSYCVVRVTSGSPGGADACCALVRRLMSTCCSWCGSPQRGVPARRGAGGRPHCRPGGIRRSSMVSATSVLSATTVRSEGCWRAKVRNCRTRRSQRAAAWAMSAAGSASGPALEVF